MNARRGKPEKAVNGSKAVAVLRLYVAGDAPNSVQAVLNIEAICRDDLGGACDLEIIDVLQHPQRAMAAGVVVTPTLNKDYPLPTAQVVGNLSDKLRVLLAIGIRSPEND
ncbi:MAG: circadian clock KaiB family protein [Gammaproteobacteria bacterium]|nr:circadian clock KaiB family protein [Gammaproteobacteria bacterium]